MNPRTVKSIICARMNEFKGKKRERKNARDHETSETITKGVS